MKELNRKNKPHPLTELNGQHTDLILKNIDEVIYYVTLGKGGKEIVFLSDKIVDILGISKKKYLGLGRKILDYCYKEDIPEILTQTTRILKKKTKGSFRYRFYNPKRKEYVWVEETIYPQLDKKKKLIGYFGVSRNIESEKRFEQQIIESEKKFRLLAENSSDIIFHFQFKPEPGYTYVSPSVKRILGYSPEEFYKDELIGYKIIHPADRELLLNSQENVIKKREIKKTFTKLAARYLTKKGDIVWLENRYSPIYSGKQIVGLHCVSRDITDQKLKEEELDHSKTQLSKILSNLPGMAYRCLNDDKWTMKFISSGSAEVTGYKPEELIENKKRSFASIVHPEDRQAGSKEIREALRKKKSFEIEYRLIDKSGKVKWIWEKGSGVYNKNKLLYIEGFINDISERKSAEDELNQRWLNYRNLVDAMPVGVFIHVDGKIQFGNKMAFDIAEISKKDNLKEFSLIDFLNKKDQPLAIERIRRAMAGEDTPFIEYEIRTRKGTHKVVRTKSSPIIYNSTHAVQIVIQDITNEKKLEEIRIKSLLTEQTNKELQEEVAKRVSSEQKLKAIFESTSHLIWTINKNMEIVSYNKQYHDSVKKLCGIVIQPGMKTTAFKNVFDPADYETLREAHRSAFMGKDTRIEIPLHAIDGKTYNREMHFHPININGQINEIAAVAQDTTERRNYEKQIIEQASKLKAIFDSGNQNIWTVNKDLLLTSFNKNFAESMSFAGKAPEMYNSVIEPVKNTPYGDTWKERYAAAFRGETVEFETSRNIDGKNYYAQVYLHPVFDQNGKVSEVAGISQNITDRKNYEQQILEQSAKLKAIFDSGSQRIWTVDRDYRLTSFNENFVRIYEITLGRKPELNASALQLVENTPYYYFWKEKYNDSFKGKSFAFETEHTLESGKSLYGQVFFHPIYDAKGRVAEVAALSQDITDRKNAEKQINEQSARLRAIFKSGSQLMWTVDRKLQLTSFNKNYADAIYELYGTYPELNTEIDRMPHTLRSQEYSEFWSGKYEEVLSGKSVEFDTERTTLTGKKIYRHIFLHPIFNDKNEAVEVSAVGYDITGQKKAQEEILNKQSQLEAIINTTNDIIFSIDQDLKLVEFNDVLSRIVYERSGLEIYQGMPVFDLLPAARRDDLISVYKRVLGGESITAIEMFEVGKEERIYEAHYNPIMAGNRITGIAVFSRDITEQKRSEEEILNKQSRLSAIINNTNDIILSIDKNYNLVEFNEVLFNMVKTSMGKTLKPGMSVFDTMDKEYHSGMREIYKRVFEGESVSSIGQFGNDENKMFLETHYNPIKTGDKITGIAIFSSDISAQKKSEEETLKSLKEKEVLLKEVHHRVKNNLQVISSILNLQTAYLKDRSTINLLKECQNRIKTMAFIHESLYQNKDFSQINFSEYIITLVKNLFYSYEANQQKIRTNFAVDTIFLNLDLSIPCGLIVNELVSNALKYAFDDGREGTIFITLKKEKGKIKMVVADNGKGMPDSINFRNTETLGLQLVTTLTEQINGTISMNKNKGTTFEIIF
jgi:PAS domain S-box-containing protein